MGHEDLDGGSLRLGQQAGEVAADALFRRLAQGRGHRGVERADRAGRGQQNRSGTVRINGMNQFV
jgi:hypothetical protein